MEIIFVFWNQYLYIPLYNFLVWLYLNYSYFNLGVAVITLTVVLRLVLLPFTILAERGKIAGKKAEEEVRQIQRDLANDPIKQRQLIRRYLKKVKMRPWAKAVVLGVQALVLLLLYQVFLSGINAQTNSPLLYPSIPRPDFINTKFLWFDIAQQNLAIAAIAAGYLLIEILIGQWEQRVKPTAEEQTFALLFPLATFLILAWLPAVKSLFILTSLIFSSIIDVIVIIVDKVASQAKKKPNDF